jgi:hypothetical protein
VKVRYVERVAIHSGPESCAGTREGVSEALTGVRAGQPSSATRGRPEVGLALLDKLDRSLGRRPARKKATG